MARRGCVWLGLMAVIAACGDNRYSITDYTVDIDAARARYAVRCGVFPDVETWKRERLPTWIHHDLLAAIDEGIVVWNADAGRACVELYDTRSCDRTSASFRQPCAPLVSGTLGDGESCAFASECISNECWFTSEECSEACCRGTCIGDVEPTLGRLGDPCRYAACAEGRCEDSTCVELLPQGSACRNDGDCEYGLSCFYVDSTRRLECREPAGSGEACAVPGWVACREIGDVCGALSDRCQQAGEIGSSCFAASDCQPHLECDIDKCADRRPAVGESCSLGLQCSDPAAYCSDFFDGVCTLRLPDGEQCASDGECISWSCALGRCTSQPCI